MEKRTGMKWDKHELNIIKTEHVLIHDLKVPNSVIYRVRFINTCGNLLVNGDFGRWSFCREFHPHKDFGGVSGSYWCEKLLINSTQKYSHYDSDETQNEIERSIEEIDGEGHEPEVKEEILGYLKSCLFYVGDELDYTHYAYREFPSCMDYEDVVFEKSVDLCLLIIFDAFEEICRRLKDG